MKINDKIVQAYLNGNSIETMRKALGEAFS